MNYQQFLLYSERKVIITDRSADSCKMHLLIREWFVNATKAGVG